MGDAKRFLWPEQVYPDRGGGLHIWTDFLFTKYEFLPKDVSRMTTERMTSNNNSSDLDDPADRHSVYKKISGEKLIQPTQGWGGFRLRELWEYRELIYFLIWRDIKVRYKQTVLGAAWAIIQPFFTMLVFSLFFGRLAKIPSDGIPYPIFSFSALVPWTFFAHGVSQSANSLVSSADLVTKVYFPRLAIPIATVLSGMVDFILAFVVLLGMILYFGITPTVNIFWLPSFLLMALVTSIGAGLWLSALNVQFRDVRYIVPFLTQFWLFATPIAYPSSLLPEPWRTLYGINPMVGVIEGFRWTLLGTDTAPGFIIIVSIFAALALLLSGAYYFRHMEKTFADII
jgi:lipopolysaccharide transport system permease protein